MLSELFKNIVLAKKAKYSSITKVVIFFTLIKLMFKKTFIKHHNAKEKIFGYTVAGADYSSFDFLYKEIFCSGVYFFKTDSKAPVIIDCGANIGMAVLYFKKLHPAAQIIAFEPNPTVYSLLQQNIKNNNLKDVEALNIALYSEEKELSFFVSEDSGILRSSVIRDRGGQNELIVKAEKLSDCLKKLKRVDMIKIDVEGAELNIIQDLFESETLVKADQYIIEYHHNLNNEKPGFADFLQKFESAGFNYSIKASFYRVSGFQEILVYFYKDKPG